MILVLLAERLLLADTPSKGRSQANRVRTRGRVLRMSDWEGHNNALSR